MRLFTAVWPPDGVLRALRDALDAEPVWHPEGRWRPVPPRNLHVTLAFHGDDEPGPRARTLAAELAGRPAPWLRLAGLGTFPGVVWARVREADEDGAGASLGGLAAAAGGDPASLRAHLTLARRSRTDDRRYPALAPGARLAPGPWWRPTEALLVRSDRGPDGVGYTPVHRVPLAAPGGRGPGEPG